MTAKLTGVRPADMRGSSRSRHISDARHVAMWLTRHLHPHASLKAIGRCFAKDHTSVLHAIRRVQMASGELAQLRDTARRVVNGIPREPQAQLMLDVTAARFTVQRLIGELYAIHDRLCGLLAAHGGNSVEDHAGDSGLAP